MKTKSLLTVGVSLWLAVININGAMNILSLPFEGDSATPYSYLDNNVVAYQAPANTPVLAAFRGVVGFVATNDTMGPYIMVAHGEFDGVILQTYYGNLKSIGVSPNDTVFAGQQIGESDDGGLYFQARVDRVPVDPYDPANFLWLMDPPTSSRPYTFLHAYTGKGEKQGGITNGWQFYLPIRTNVFGAGEPVKLIVGLTNINVLSYRWKADVYKGDVKLTNHFESSWTYQTHPQTYDSWSLDGVPFFEAGDYSFKLYVNVGDETRLDHLADVPFTVVGVVNTNTAPFTYDDDGVVGYRKPTRLTVNDMFVLESYTNIFEIGDPIYALVHARNADKSHKWRVKIFEAVNNFTNWKLVDGKDYYFAINNFAPGEIWTISPCWSTLELARSGSYKSEFYLEFENSATNLFAVLYYKVKMPDGSIPPDVKLSGVSLQISRANSLLLISWPTNEVVLKLQSSEALGPGAVWQDFDASPTVTDGHWLVSDIVRSRSNNKFYRLVK